MTAAIAQYTAADVRGFDAGDFLSRLLEPLDDDHPVGVRWDEFDDGAVAFVAEHAQDPRLAQAATAEAGRRGVTIATPVPPHVWVEVVLRACARACARPYLRGQGWYVCPAADRALAAMRGYQSGRATSEDVYSALRRISDARAHGASDMRPAGERPSSLEDPYVSIAGQLGPYFSELQRLNKWRAYLQDLEAAAALQAALEAGAAAVLARAVHTERRARHACECVERVCAAGFPRDPVARETMVSRERAAVRADIAALMADGAAHAD